MGDGLLRLGTGPLRRRSIGMDRCFPGPVPLQPVIYDVGEGVLARQVEVEGLGAPRRAEDAADAAAPYKAAPSYTSA